MKQHQLWLWALGWSFFLLLMAILIPGIVVKQLVDEQRPETSWLGGIQLEPNVELNTLDQPSVPVYITQLETIETVPLEAYVRGVIAAEMPIEFELEALKAQAIAARTYIIRRMMHQDVSNVPVEGALVTDTISHQAYITTEELKKKWNALDYAKHIDKLNRAVNETAGKIATYGGEPIQAVFFSTSNGFTEHSEDYFRDEIPYLRSVPSPWDPKLSPRYEQTVTLTIHEMLWRLGISDSPSVENNGISMEILNKTAGQRVDTIEVEGKRYTGRQIRELLGLASSDFTWKQEGEKITFMTHGYGHGVGMSQWGANGMAKEGKTAEEIIRYYYSGVQLETINYEITQPLMARIQYESIQKK